MQTFLPAEALSDEERTTEVAEIHAAGVIRLLKSQKESDVPLDYLPAGSVHHDRYHNGEDER
jgi:hypothetical protein